MEECGNLSNSSVMPNPDLTAFVIVLSIASVPLTIFNGLIAVLLLQSTSVVIQVRMSLTNLLLETLITNIVLLCTVLILVALSLSDANELPWQLCQFALWLYSVTVVARLLGLLISSVLMFQTVASGRRKIRVKWLMCSLVAAWMIAIPSRIDILVPGIHGFHYVGGIACFPTAGCPEYRAVRLTYSILWLLIACFVPLLVCICVLLATVCYIKRHTFSEGALYKKALAKFAAFLIAGNVLNFLGVVLTVALAQDVSSMNSVGVYITYITILLSYIPTPILIVVFLKPVQKRLHRLFCNRCWKVNEAVPMQQAENLYN